MFFCFAYSLRLPSLQASGIQAVFFFREVMDLDPMVFIAFPMVIGGIYTCSLIGILSDVVGYCKL